LRVSCKTSQLQNPVEISHTIVTSQPTPAPAKDAGVKYKMSITVVKKMKNRGEKRYLPKWIRFFSNVEWGRYLIIY
jgi:hypothetical protein